MDQVDHILAQWRKERPDLDVHPMGTFGRLKRLTDHLSRELAQVYQKHDLNAASFDVLATLRRSGSPYSLTPSALIEWTMVASGTMTNRLDRLEASGLVVRQSNPEDGRGFVVTLTDRGFKLIDHVVDEHVANQHRLMEGLSPQHQAQADEGLRALLGLFETK